MSINKLQVPKTQANDSKILSENGPLFRKLGDPDVAPVE